MFFALANLSKSFNGAIAATAKTAVAGMAVGALLNAGQKNDKKPPSLISRMF